MKYFSTFSGIGGFELGIQQAYEKRKNSPTNGCVCDTDSDEHEQERPWRAPTCIGYSEIDKYAVQVYQKHFPNHKNYGDITKIDETSLPDFDLFVGGFPCQSFSIAGKRGGFDDTRGTMFFEIARIVREKQPRLLLLENVKGLLSHDKGRTFYTIISTLDELGYDCQWQVLNSKNFGVPQNRERVFIIGHLRGTSRPEVFPIGQNDGEVIELSGQQTNTLTARYEGAQATGSYVIEGKLNAQERGNRQPFVAPVLTPDRPNKRQNGRRFKENGEPSFTLTAQDKHGVLVDKTDRVRVYSDGTRYEKETLDDGTVGDWEDVTNKAIRRLTPTECERLQGFPNGWTEGLSDTQRYKTLGNAVTVNVIEDIMKALLRP